MRADELLPEDEGGSVSHGSVRRPVGGVRTASWPRWFSHPGVPSLGLAYANALRFYDGHTSGQYREVRGTDESLNKTIDGERTKRHGSK